MDILEYIKQMQEMYGDDVITTADGGRIGFYKGKSVVESHGKEIKELTEAGESSVSIAKKLNYMTILLKKLQTIKKLENSQKVHTNILDLIQNNNMQTAYYKNN